MNPFDLYDTKRLKEAHQLLVDVYNYNYDSSRKCKLLATIIRKVERLIEKHGETKV